MRIVHGPRAFVNEKFSTTPGLNRRELMEQRNGASEACPGVGDCRPEPVPFRECPERDWPCDRLRQSNRTKKRAELYGRLNSLWNTGLAHGGTHLQFRRGYLVFGAPPGWRSLEA